MHINVLIFNCGKSTSDKVLSHFMQQRGIFEFTHRKSASCLLNSVLFNLFSCTPSSIGCFPSISSTNMGTFKSGNSSKLSKASSVTENLDDKLDLRKFMKFHWNKCKIECVFKNYNSQMAKKNETGEKFIRYLP